MPTSVVVADDHPIVLDGLANLIGADPLFEVVGAAANGPAALQLIRDLAPAIAVLDLRMPGLSGIGVINTMRAEGLATKVVILTATISDADVYDAIDGGAAGLTLKEAAPETLLDCLREVAAGRMWLPTSIVDVPLARETARRARWSQLSQDLTAREFDVVHLVIGGHVNKQIAYELGVSEGTIKVHLNSIFRKLRVSSRTELLELGAGLIGRPEA